VVRIGVHAYPYQFRIDLCTPGPGRFILFQDHDAGAVAEDKTIAVTIPGTAGPFRIVIASGECAGRGKATQSHRSSGHFGTAGNHHVHVAMPDQTGRFTDVVSTGATGGYNGIVGSFQSRLDGEVPSDHIDDIGWHEEW